MLVSCVPNYYYYFLFECWTLYVKNHRNNLRPRMMLLSYKENLHVLLTRRDCWELQQSMILVCRRANLLLIHLTLLVLPWYLWCACQGLISKFEGFTEASPWQSVDFSFCPYSPVRLSEILLIFSPSQSLLKSADAHCRKKHPEIRAHLSSHSSLLIFCCNALLLPCELTFRGLLKSYNLLLLEMEVQSDIYFL